jgi:hypothetical protein
MSIRREFDATRRPALLNRGGFGYSLDTPPIIAKDNF